MASRDLKLDVLVRLKENLTTGMRSILRFVDRIKNMARSIGILGTAIAGLSFLAPIQEAAAFQQKMLDIAGTSNLMRSQAFSFAADLTRQFEALSLKVGQTSDTIAEGAGQMVAAGLDMGLIQRNIATIGKSATAANAEFSDLAAVSTSLLQTLKVPELELEGALAGLTMAGKQGAFELKDMARFFPQLTGQMAKFGITGRQASDQLASMLQIARMGTSYPGIAANNLNNFLSKALAPITQKNFKDMGVNIEAVMLDATAKGVNPLEAMLQKIGKLTGTSGDQIAGMMDKAKKRGLEGADALAEVKAQLEAIGAAGKMGQLFGDQQVMDFLIPMMANLQEYKRIKAEVAGATGQIITDDFETQMAGLNRQMTILREIGTQGIRAVGLAFGEWLPSINANLMRGMNFMRELDASTGGMVQTMLTLGGGAVLATGALGALGIALPIVGAGLAAIGSLAALALSPIGLAVGALAAGGAYIWRNWESFGPRLTRLWERTRDGFTSFARGAIDRGRDLLASGRQIADRYGPMIADGLTRGWREAAELGRRYGPMIGERLSAGWDRAKQAFGSFLTDFRAGSGAISREWSEFMGTMETLSGSFGGLFEAIQPMLKREFENAKATIGNIGKRFSGGEGLGSILSRETANAINTFNRIGRGIDTVVKAVTEVTKAINEGTSIDWKLIVPDWLVGAFNDVSGAIGTVSGALRGLIELAKSFQWPSFNFNANAGGLPATNAPNPTIAPTIPQLNVPGRPANDYLSPAMKGFRPDFSRPPAFQAPQQQGARASSSKFAELMPRSPREKIDTGGVLRIVVEGPGKVAGATMNDPRIRVDGGRMVGRA